MDQFYTLGSYLIACTAFVAIVYSFYKAVKGKES